ncbi:MAG: phosphatidate cytidylyltransferase [Candidatus Promineifilaceae bacterium]|nr:phosphatidate cytidylyltransferase [Candidatus Promineifilaceae bacterium]
MFWRRAAVTFTVGPLVLVIIHFGGWIYFSAFAFLLTLGVHEYSKLADKLGWAVPLWLILPIVLGQWLLPVTVQRQLFPEMVESPELLGGALLVSLLAIMFYALWLFERRQAVNAAASWAALVLGVVILGWLGSHFFRLRGLSMQAAEWTAVAMVSAWLTDSGAYVFGKLLGRRRLSPRLSPNKTVAGYVGGAVTGTAAAAIGAALLDLTMALAILVGGLVAIFGPLGDLGISLLKRTVGVKDSGQFLPGHGGALDRIDSLVWSVAITYYVVLFFA